MPSPRPTVHLTAIRENTTLAAARNLAARHKPNDFEILSSGKNADIFLYIEYGYIGLVDLPRLLRQINSAPNAFHFLFSEADWPYPILPGAYPSLSRQFPWAQSWAYLPKHNSECIVYPSVAEPRLLFSFLGRTSTHPVRKELIRLDSATTPCVDFGPRLGAVA